MSATPTHAANGLELPQDVRLMVRAFDYHVAQSRRSTALSAAAPDDDKPMHDLAARIHYLHARNLVADVRRRLFEVTKLHGLVWGPFSQKVTS